MKKEEIARLIYDLAHTVKGLGDEKEELREILSKRMAVGEIVRFETPEGLYRAKKCPTFSTIMKEPEDILGLVGEDIFVASVKVNTEKLKELVSFQVYEMCIKAKDVPGDDVLKILKGGG